MNKMKIDLQNLSLMNTKIDQFQDVFNDLMNHVPDREAKLPDREFSKLNKETIKISLSDYAMNPSIINKNLLDEEEVSFPV